MTTSVTFVCLADHRWHMGVGKGNATAAANSFQARKGATGVIGHNLVDSLIYKQSLMKFLVFINNALQPRAPVCRHRYPGIPRCLSLSLSLPLFTTPFYTLPFSCSYRFRATRTIVRHPLSPWLSTNPLSATRIYRMNQRANMLHIVTVALDFFIDYTSTNRYNSFAYLKHIKNLYYIIIYSRFKIKD